VSGFEKAEPSVIGNRFRLARDRFIPSFLLDTLGTQDRGLPSGNLLGFFSRSMLSVFETRCQRIKNI
jgi:hypothetical protein